MVHDIPVRMFPDLLNNIGLLSKEATNSAKLFLEADDLIGLLEFLRMKGVGFDPDLEGIPNTCKDVNFALDLPDEYGIGQETAQCKSIW